VALDVPETHSIAGWPCRHLRARGCGEYRDRPEACREFYCAWRLGLSELDPREHGCVVTLTETTVGMAYLVLESAVGSSDPHREALLADARAMPGVEAVVFAPPGRRRKVVALTAEAATLARGVINANADED
jgi:hypothetical protein